MNLKKAQDIAYETIKNKQDPDEVVFTKQWNEFGFLKGWMAHCKFGSKTIMFDITKHYTRVVGDLDEIPEHEPGVHKVIN